LVSRIANAPRWQSKAQTASGFSINNLVAQPEKPEPPAPLALPGADYREPVQLELPLEGGNRADFVI